MKVSELIDLLQDFDGDKEVLFQYNFGDYWRTQVAMEITSIGDGQVKYSQYHDMDKVIGRYDEDEMQVQDARQVILIG